MGREIDGDAVVYIGPFGMMADRFGVQGHAAHEPEGGDEVGKFVFSVEFGVAVLPVG